MWKEVGDWFIKLCWCSWRNLNLDTCWPKETRFWPKEIFCGCKYKFGLNMQAVWNANYWFISVQICHPGATSNYLDFATTNLNFILNSRNSGDQSKPFLKEGLTIYGDNAYVNTSYMITAYSNILKGPQDASKDAFNFFQSQLQITIECAFGKFVQRWGGILRKPIAQKIEVSKIASLVLCLCKVHNFCINENDKTPDTAMEDDEVNTVFAGGIHLHNSDTIRTALLDGGNFTSDHNSYLRESWANCELPASKMLDDSSRRTQATRTESNHVT